MPMSPEAKSLIDAARRRSDGPSPQARDRMRRKVLGAIGAGAASIGAASSVGVAGAATATGGAAATGTAVATAGAGTTVGLVGKILAVVVVVGAAAGGVGLSMSKPSPEQQAPAQIQQQAEARPRGTSSVATPTPTASATTPIAIEPAASATASASASSTPVAQVTSSARTSAEAKDPLQEETALLASAQAALSAGNPKKALALTDQHASRFPKGDLASERRAIRAVALCQLGRADEGRNEARGLDENGLMADRVRSSCK